MCYSLQRVPLSSQRERNRSTCSLLIHADIQDQPLSRHSESEPSFIDIELFGGAGGLAIGLTSGGFPPSHIFELDEHCCATLRHNSDGINRHINATIHQEDITTVDWNRFSARVRLLAAGPPCQPFSNGGKHLADLDHRNQFPATLHAIASLQPDLVVLENVPGLMRESFKRYFDYIIRQLQRPSQPSLPNETWQQHSERLREMTAKDPSSIEYNVYRWAMNVADYGVPQARVRLFVVAVCAALPPLQKPRPTHSRAALQKYQATGAYWRDRDLPVRTRLKWPRRTHGHESRTNTTLRPWVTVRDALSGLPAPTKEDDDGNNHWLIPGARVYRGHSGSELDWPAKTIKAGVHGVSGGENVLLLDDGKYRYFTLREMARLQGFQMTTTSKDLDHE